MNIVFVGTPATPYAKRACDVRLASFANIMAKEHNVCILNRYSHIRDCGDIKVNPQIDVREIISKKSSMQTLWLCLSLLLEPFSLLRLRFKKKIDILHVYSGHYIDFLLYKIIAKIIGAKVVYQYVEFRTAKPIKNIYHKWNAKMCDYKGPKLWDGVISISNYLTKQSLKINPKLKYVKVTPICDYTIIDQVKPANMPPYLMFCGSLNYHEVIDLISNAYRKSAIKNKVHLILVLGGKKDKIEEFRAQNPDINVMNNIPYETLLGLYKGASGLIIPIRNTIEDIARFPNKICEYLAARGLVITTKFGESPNYFVDRHNALVANDFTVEALVEKLNWLAENFGEVESLKTNAYYELLNTFNQDSNSEIVNEFLYSLR